MRSIPAVGGVLQAKWAGSADFVEVGGHFNAAAQTGAMAMSSCFRKAVSSEASITLPGTDMNAWELSTTRRRCFSCSDALAVSPQG
jgi:hypothetical protein